MLFGLITDLYIQVASSSYDEVQPIIGSPPDSVMLKTFDSKMFVP